MSMTQEQIEKLLVPFPASDIEYLEKGGKSLAYVSHPAVNRRLIEVFGGDWSFEIVETKIETDQAVVLGRLTCAGATRMAWGGSRVNKGDLDDALKGAGSYSLKKCASLFGIGLHLWEAPPSKAENDRARRAEAAPTVKTAGGPPVKSQAQTQQPTNGPVNGPHGLASERQMAAVKAMARKLNLSDQALDKMCRQRYQHGLSEISRETASDMITGMQQKLNGAAEAA